MHVTLRLLNGSEPVLHGVRAINPTLTYTESGLLVQCGEIFGEDGPALWLCPRCTALADAERRPCSEYHTVARYAPVPDVLLVTLADGQVLVFPPETQVVNVETEDGDAPVGD